MLKTKQYNRVSKETLSSIKKLERGKTVVFRLLNYKKDPVTGKSIYNSSVTIPPFDTIYDDGAGDFVQIAAISSVTGGGDAKFIDINFSGSRAGTVILNGNSNLDMQIYEYLQLCNFNSSNPNRDKTKPAIFEFVDKDASAGRNLDNLELKADALIIAKGMGDKDAFEFSISRGKPHGWTINQCREFIMQLAIDDPEGFIKMSKSDEKTLRANISRAMVAKIISYNKKENKFTWTANGDTIITLPRSTTKDHIGGLAEFCKNKTAGRNFYNEICTILFSPNEAVPVKEIKAEAVTEKKEEMATVTDDINLPPLPTSKSRGKK